MIYEISADRLERSTMRRMPTCVSSVKIFSYEGTNEKMPIVLLVTYFNHHIEMFVDLRWMIYIRPELGKRNAMAEIRNTIEEAVDYMHDVQKKFQTTNKEGERRI